MDNRKVILLSLLAVVSLLLLSSIGGAGAAAAPVLLPLQFLAAKSSRGTGLRVWWGLVGAITAAEGAWLATYLAVDESQPVIWLLPAVAAIVAGTLIFLGSRKPSTT